MSLGPTQSRVTVGNTPALLASSVGANGTAFIVRNTDATLSVFVGNSAVTTSDGFEVKAGEALSGGLGFGGAGVQTVSELYAVSAGSVVVDVVTRVAI